MGRFYTIEQAGREAHLYIFGDIVPDQWFEGEVSAFSFQQELAQIDADVIHVHIDSYGGTVSAGWAIYNTLRDHYPRRRLCRIGGAVPVYGRR